MTHDHERTLIRREGALKLADTDAVEVLVGSSRSSSCEGPAPRTGHRRAWPAGPASRPPERLPTSISDLGASEQEAGQHAHPLLGAAFPARTRRGSRPRSGRCPAGPAAAKGTRPGRGRAKFEDTAGASSPLISRSRLDLPSRSGRSGRCVRARGSPGWGPSSAKTPRSWKCTWRCSPTRTVRPAGTAVPGEVECQLRLRRQRLPRLFQPRPRCVQRFGVGLVGFTGRRLRRALQGAGEDLRQASVVEVASGVARWPCCSFARLLLRPAFLPDLLLRALRTVRSAASLARLGRQRFIVGEVATVVLDVVATELGDLVHPIEQLCGRDSPPAGSPSSPRSPRGGAGGRRCRGCWSVRRAAGRRVA